MFSNFKQMLVFYLISFANFLTNGQITPPSTEVVEAYGSNNVENKSLCYDFEEKLNTMAKTVGGLQMYMNSIISEIDELQLLRENLYESRLQLEAKLKSPPNILEVKCANDRLPGNCHEVHKCHNHLYRVTIANFSESSFPVSCDMETEDQAWTVIQRRQDGSVNFHRNWTEYVHGFGDLNGEFFIGLEKLHALTTMGVDQKLYIMVEDFEGVRRYAKYNSFQVDSEATGYKLTVGNYSGNAGDSFSQHSTYKFHTWDRDNGKKCASTTESGWWFDNCYNSNLNGKYLMGKVSLDDNYGVVWQTFRGRKYSLKFSQMMISSRIN